MKLFNRANCGNLLSFENRSCAQCATPVGFLPDRLQLAPIEPADRQLWQPVGVQGANRKCQNGFQLGVCNVRFEAERAQPFWRACDLNATIPNRSVPGHLGRWQRLETEKRRLITEPAPATRWRQSSLPIKSSAAGY